MKDIIIAKEILQNNSYTITIVKNQKILKTSKQKGIRPMYEAITQIKDELKNASVADRVIGRAAAILLKYGEVKNLNTKIISKDALEILNNTNINVRYEKIVEFIKNRDKKDSCPVEKLSKDIEDPIILISKIKAFLESIN
ncbi:DUF1893 domain-containing protein [Peptostreptococcaceae bacterium AGR-M142]